MKLFKIHPSQAAKIYGDVGKPTEKQLARLDELQKRKDGVGKPLTPNMEDELKELIAKRDSKPSLSKGAKEYCQLWIKEQLYGRRKEFSSKYTEKGNLCENEGIELTCEVMGYGMAIKNDVTFETDYMIGTCDLLLPEIVEDIKCSWDFDTFPLFEDTLPNNDYYLQLQCYMKGYNRNKAAVNYCLLDAPEEIVISEAWRWAKRMGLDEVDAELSDKVTAHMTYSNLPIKLRFKRYEFDRDDTVIAAIEQQVILCREYIETLKLTCSTT